MACLQLTMIQYSYLLYCFLTVNRFGPCEREILEPMDKCSLIPEGRVLVHAKVRTFQYRKKLHTFFFKSKNVFANNKVYSKSTTVKDLQNGVEQCK